MQINQQKTVQVEAKILRLCIKVRDGFGCDIFDQDGRPIGGYEGYVPGFFPGEHYGDYLMFDIDLDTGRITNWKPPTANQIEALLGADGV